jgi:malonyl-CoA O-methyltransferase
MRRYDRRTRRPDPGQVIVTAGAQTRCGAQPHCAAKCTASRHDFVAHALQVLPYPHAIMVVINDMICSPQIAAMCAQSVLPSASMADSANKAHWVGGDIRRRFERAAATFDRADFVHAATRAGLLARLEPLLVDARTVVDLGAATGSTLALLCKRFSRARIVSVDIAHRMLVEGRKKKSWRMRASFVQANATALPFSDQSVDVVFANMLLPWVDNLPVALNEVSRVLRKGGVFVFATLGPDSLHQLDRAWRTVDNDAHVGLFPDMHDLGDGLVRAGLANPVLDVDRLRVRYDSTDKLFADLTSMGGRNSLAGRRSTLTGRRHFERMTAELPGGATDRKITLDLELVYGHCWGSGPKADNLDYRIDATRIPIR